MSTEQVTQEATRLLAQLRDIQLPEPTGNWAPAMNVGWLSAAGILVLLVGLILLRGHYLRTRTRRYALQELEQMSIRFVENQQHQRLLNELNTLLRRVAIMNYGREEVSPLTGEQWLEFLDRSGRTQDFLKGPGQVLIQAYQASPEAFDENTLIEVVKQWIKRQL